MNCPDITMTVQQCARLNNKPSKDHEEAAKCICRYLLGTKDKDLTLNPDTFPSFSSYV